MNKHEKECPSARSKSNAETCDWCKVIKTSKWNERTMIAGLHPSDALYLLDAARDGEGYEPQFTPSGRQRKLRAV